jgi:membrane peptidoglycan carboxypeptidase
MAQAGFITPAERAQQRFPDNWLKETPTSGGVPDDDRYHIYDRARAELAAQNITEDDINTLGLTITTTVDPARQKDAVDAVNKTMKGQPDNLRAAVVSVDPRTGAILAYYGGTNGLGTDYAESLRQPGSSFKPFVLSAALQADDGVGLGSVYDGSSPQTFAGVKVANSDGESCAQCTVKTAMTESINTVFYKMAIDTGVNKVVDAAHQAGIPKDLLPVADGGIALGDQEVHPLDMASAYGTFAADGVHHDPYIVSKVVAADGRVLLDRTPSAGEQGPTAQVARNVTESMLDVADSSRIGLSDGRPVAAKTGTVQIGKSNDNKDAWTVGYTPSLSTAVWVGTDRSDPLKTKSGAPVYGRTLPGPIWQSFMNNALKGTPKEQFAKLVPIGKPPAADPGSGSSDTPSPSGAPQSGSAPTSSQSGDRSGDSGDSGDGGGGDGGDGGDSGNPFDNGGGFDPPGRGNRGATPADADTQGRTVPAAAVISTPAPSAAPPG